jgi:hypothetical protein
MGINERAHFDDPTKSIQPNNGPRSLIHFCQSIQITEIMMGFANLFDGGNEI